MAVSALKAKNNVVPQNQKASKGQKRNNAGGYSFKVSGEDRLRRFLTIGCANGTYYVNEKNLTQDSIKFVEKFVKKSGDIALAQVIDVSDNGLAKKNDYALYVLAAIFAFGDDELKSQARIDFNKVVRTTDHLAIFLTFLKENFNKGVGTSVRRAIAAWYENRSVDSLAYQVTKYRQRGGYTHRDLLRIGHPKDLNENVGNFILGNDFDADESPWAIQAFEALQNAKTVTQVIKILNLHPKAPWEFVPTQFLTDAKIWRTIFENGGMGQTALIRNVTKMNDLGLFNDMKFAADYADALTDQAAIIAGRVHPMAYLQTHAMFRGNTHRNARIVDALSKGYNLAFKNIVPANKRTLIGLDVSGSMSWSASGMKNVSAALAGGALAQVLTANEPYSEVLGFSTTLVPVNIGPNTRLDSIVNTMMNVTMGGTDLAQPMIHALNNKIEVETFITITDNETWAGRIHPHVALEQYRQKMGIDAKMVVAAMTPTRFTIADSNDSSRQLDVSGFDASVPGTIADFSAGRLS